MRHNALSSRLLSKAVLLSGMSSSSVDVIHELHRFSLWLGLLKTVRVLLTNQDCLRQVLSHWLSNVNKSCEMPVAVGNLEEVGAVTNDAPDNGQDLSTSQVT
jgi:hypothetical protein